MMNVLAFLVAVVLLWLIVKPAGKGWRLFLAMCLAALISGCSSTSKQFGMSPCACIFTPLNTGNFGGETIA